MAKAGLDRRDFFKFTAAAAACAAVPAVAKDASGKSGASSAPGAVSGKLIASAPVLQNAAETTMGVSFAVSSDASGWVEYSTRPDMKDAKRVYSGSRGLMDVDDKVALVRIRGLEPATRYWYRIGADRIDYAGGYKMKNLGPEADPAVHSFATLGRNASGSFCVINDTHESKGALDLVFAKIKELNPAVVIWNGDASNTSETIERGIGVFIKPHPSHPAYAADTPYIFLNGNHDYRGRFNRRLETLMMPREASERDSRFAELGRNFALRLGGTALIGLDTGEDKLDTNPVFAGLFKMKEYRELQTLWLEKTIESEAVRTARHKVAFCHIPLFDPRPWANPGDVAPADAAPQYRHDYAIWQRTCANMWSPLFEKAGVQLVVAAHQHYYRFDPPQAGRTWTQIVGGGPKVPGKEKIDPMSCPTVVEGKEEGGRLVVRVHHPATGEISGPFEFA